MMRDAHQTSVGCVDARRSASESCKNCVRALSELPNPCKMCAASQIRLHRSMIGLVAHVEGTTAAASGSSPFERVSDFSSCTANREFTFWGGRDELVYMVGRMVGRAGSRARRCDEWWTRLA